MYWRFSETTTDYVWCDANIIILCSYDLRSVDYYSCYMLHGISFPYLMMMSARWLMRKLNYTLNAIFQAYRISFWNNYITGWARVQTTTRVEEKLLLCFSSHELYYKVVIIFLKHKIHIIHTPRRRANGWTESSGGNRGGGTVGMEKNINLFYGHCFSHPLPRSFFNNSCPCTICI